MGLSYGLPLGI